MLNSRLSSDGRRPEKSSFAHTCNLLSQYIKEKGNLRDLNIEIGGKVENLETLVKPPASTPTPMGISENKGKSAQLSREQQPSDSFTNTAEEASYKHTSKEATTTDTKTSQLTIFYSGRVLVFDDFPSNKVKELVACAKKGSSQMSYGILSNTLGEKSNPGVAAAAASGPREGLPPRPQACSSHKGVGISSNTCKEITNTDVSGTLVTSSTSEKQVAPEPEACGSDMPIARRSSLHRFLEKRKDRAAVRGPYQVQEQPTSSSSKGDERLELKL